MKYLTLLLLVCGYSSFCQKIVFQDEFKEDFSKPFFENFNYGSTGELMDFSFNQGIDSPTEPGTKILSFKINPAEKAGAGRGPEIISNNFTHFGSYAARLKVPNVKEQQPNVGAVVGYFTYHSDSLTGLSEIDFEWLLANPSIIYVGTWTGPKGRLRRIGRTINMATGQIYATETRVGDSDERVSLTGEQNLPVAITTIPNYDASAQFYTYGFDWYADRIKWWIQNPKTQEKIILWDYRGSTLGIPQEPSRYRMNFWHTNNWSVETNPLSIEKPKYPFELEVDWMSFKPLDRN
jgi:hypothetical protein